MGWGWDGYIWGWDGMGTWGVVKEEDEGDDKGEDEGGKCRVYLSGRGRP